MAKKLQYHYQYQRLILRKVTLLIFLTIKPKTMSIKINKTTPDSYVVNGKPIFTDMNGKLLAPIELTPEELKAFNEFLTSDAREASDNQSK